MSSINQASIIFWVGSAKHWYLNGLLHRENEHAVEWVGGTKHWYLNGQRHRENGPAIEWEDGGNEWWLNGRRHRENGPAVECADGVNGWYLNGVKYTEEEYNEKLRCIRKLYFKYFHLWYDRLDDLRTDTGQRRMFENYSRLHDIK